MARDKELQDEVDTKFHWPKGRTMFGKPLPYVGMGDVLVADGWWANQHRCARLMLWKHDCRTHLKHVLAPKGDLANDHLEPKLREHYLALRKSIKTEIFETPDIYHETNSSGRRYLSENPKDWGLTELVECVMRWMHLLKPLVLAGHLPDPVEYDIVPGKSPLHSNHMDAEATRKRGELAAL